MPANSTRKTRRRKTHRKHPVPPKPYDDFPLYAHPSGHWCKRIRGTFYYFGRWGHIRDGKMDRVEGDGWQAAEALYNVQREDLYAGRIPRRLNDDAAADDAPTLAQLCNAFLTSKLRKIDTGELSPRTFWEYKQTTDRLIAHFGKQRRVDDVRPSDFAELRGEIAKHCKLVRLGNEVSRVKSVFKFGTEEDLIAKPVRFGSEFKRPDKKAIKRQRDANPENEKVFTSSEIRLMLDAVDGREVVFCTDKKTLKPAKINLTPQPQLLAIVLLAINTGVGNTDVANLQMRHLDLDGRWMDYPRCKTGVPRRVPLWAETCQALRAAITQRPSPKDKADTGCVFLTDRGTHLVRLGQTTRTDYVCREFGNLLRKLGINGRRGYYNLRHTLATHALEIADRDAVKAILGHSQGDITAEYNHATPSESRLLVVSEHVRAWLFPITNTINQEINK